MLKINLNNINEKNGRNCVYGWIDMETGELVYIGSTFEFVLRYANHIKDRHIKRNKYLYMKTHIIEMIPLYSGDDYRKVEIEMITQHKPILNISYRITPKTIKERVRKYRKKYKKYGKIHNIDYKDVVKLDVKIINQYFELKKNT